MPDDSIARLNRIVKTLAQRLGGWSHRSELQHHAEVDPGLIKADVEVLARQGRIRILPLPGPGADESNEIYVGINEAGRRAYLLRTLQYVGSMLPDDLAEATGGHIDQVTMDLALLAADGRVVWAHRRGAEAAAAAPTSPEHAQKRPPISISQEDLARLLQENVQLFQQNTELQAAGTALVMKMRELTKHEIDVPIRLHRSAGANKIPVAPKYQSDGAVGMDLHSGVHRLLIPGARAKIPAGISMQLPCGYTAKVLPRSGLSERDGLLAIDGTIDWDYRGEISVVMLNVGSMARTIHEGERIAQLVILPVMRARLIEVESLEPTARGDKGFGSTGA